MKDKEESQIEEISKTNNKSIQDLQIQIKEKTTEFEALKQEKEDTISLLKTQITDLTRLNDRNTVLIQEKDTQIELLKSELANQHSILERLDTSTETIIKQVIGQNTDNPYVYNTNSSKLVEIIPEGDKLIVDFREKLNERADFLYWINNLQVCLSFSNTKWTLTLYSGIIKLDSAEISGGNELRDKFHRIDNRIYVGMSDSKDLYCATVGNNSLSLAKIGNSGSNFMYKIVEYNNCVYVGCVEQVVKIANNTTTTIATLGSNVRDLEIKGNTLLAVDWCGTAVTIDLNTEKEVERVKVNNKQVSFLAGEAIGSSDANKLLLLNKKGEQIIEHNTKSGNYLSVLTKMLNYTILTQGDYLYILNNTTFTLETHRIAKIPNKYTNCYSN